ncbi:thioredoxin-like protein [Chloropicon roscoffensis]|uniref:Thioredoxin-like protein n=1 Tax=Chloropicon roscoffensis TaxID=1461544 RepID=A0AAX4P5K6_9CHLO
MALRLGAGTSHAARRPAFRATGRGFAVARAQQKGGAPGLLAPAGVGLGVALFILSRTAGGGLATLSDLAASSVPLDVALSNDRPSVVEFYADWCEVCKSSAKDSAQIKERYGERVNFVMLNVDNPKWAEEVSEYRVDGIPHWEYLSSRGQAKGFVVGNLPREILDANASALAEDLDLPYAREMRSASSVSERAEATQDQGAQRQAAGGTMPRDHG